MANQGKKNKASQGSHRTRPDRDPIGPFIKDVRENVLHLTREKLAIRLGVTGSAVGAWEKNRYSPQPGNLVELGNLLPWPECLRAWDWAGVDVGKMGTVTAPPAAGVIQVPLLDVRISTSGESQYCDVPRAVVFDEAKTICARISAALFPFRPRDIVVVDQRMLGLREMEGQLVAIQFTRYPARPELYGTRQEEEQLLGWAASLPKVDLAEADREEQIKRGLVEQYEGPSAQERFKRQDAFEEELGKRWAPDLRGTIALQQIQAGWLRVAELRSPFRDDPDRWRVELRPANDDEGYVVPLTTWQTGPRGQEVKLPDAKLLGRVVSWMRPASEVQQAYAQDLARKGQNKNR